MPTPRRRAVLFDFDGIIADIENIHVAAWERTFAAMGWDVSHEVTSLAGTRDDREFLETVFAARGVEAADLEGWVARKQRLTVAMIASEPRIFSGVPGLLRALHERGVKLGIVTKTWRENVTSAFEASGLAKLVGLIVAREDLSSGNLDPEHYLLACRRLKVRPAAAVALENSAGGIEAAMAAGLGVVAVGHRLPQGDWSLGVPFVSDFRDIPQVLERLELSG